MNTNKPAQYWIDTLSLSPHPEGGYYRETYRSSDLVPAEVAPRGMNAARCWSTAIYYLLEHGDYSAFHRIKSDEMLHFYTGGPLEIHMLSQGRHTVVELGHDIEHGQHLQYIIPAGTWFAMTPKHLTPYCLLGCTVSPGFEFADFEMASAESLDREVPSLSAALLKRFPSRSP